MTDLNEAGIEKALDAWFTDPNWRISFADGPPVKEFMRAAITAYLDATGGEMRKNQLLAAYMAGYERAKDAPAPTPETREPSETGGAVSALAEAWASIDGKVDRFHADKCGELDDDDGTFDGYVIEAKEMIQRLKRRGFDVAAISATPKAKPSEEAVFEACAVAYNGRPLTDMRDALRAAYAIDFPAPPMKGEKK